jgi:hypothetical protein
MSNYEAGIASTEIVVLKVIDGDVILDLSGEHAKDARTAVSNAWSWCIDQDQSSGDYDPTTPRIEVVFDEDPDVVVEASNRGAIAATDLATVLHLLTQAITVAGIDSQAGRLLMLHAGAVADPRSRRAVVAVAATGGGKTTFVRTIGPGRVYLTDETVAIRDDHSIVPYPKPLSIHTPGLNLKEQIGPQTMGLLRPTGSYALSALWSLERSMDPTPPRYESMTTLEAITTIAPQLSYLSALPAPLHRLAGAIDAAGGMSKVVYHEADDLQALVDDALGANQ